MTQQPAASVPGRVLTHQILGGSDVIGANGHIFSHGDTRICVDLGMLLTNRDAAMPFDLVVPDILKELGKLDAIVLTHIHLDHIGAIPHLAALGHTLPPIYCEPITAELLKGSLKETLKQMRDPRAKISDSLLTFRPLKPGQILTFGDMTVEPISVAHSAAFTTALAIRAGGVTVLHSADLNAKKDVPVGPGTNFQRLGQLAAEGVDAVLLDSTRADTPGTGLDERRVGHELKRILYENKNKRVLVTCFSSSLHRIYSLMAAAAETGRTVVIDGRGIKSMLDACAKAGIDITERIPNGGPRILSGFDPKVLDLSPAQTLVIMTGCQAEPYAALTRAAQSQHPRIMLNREDVVVMSSSEIPNNGEAIAAMKAGIKATGAKLVTSSDRAIHASGHGHQEDLRNFLAVVKPRYGVPIHGDPAKRAANENLMQSAGIKTLNAGNGTVLTYGLDGAKIVDQVPSLWLGISIKSDGNGRTVGISATPFANDPKTAANDWETFKQGTIPMKPRNPRVLPTPPASGRRP